MTLISGVTGAIVGVNNFQPHIDFWCGELGWEVLREGSISNDVAQKVYGVTGQVEVKVLSVAGSKSGQIYLFKTDDSHSLEARYPHTSELGFHALDLYTKDISATYKQLSAAGIKWVREPEPYAVPLGDKVVEIVEGFCFSPEGTAVVFVEAKNARVTAAWEKNPDLPYTELTSVVTGVRDVDKLAAFFGEQGLGLSQWYDVSFSSPGLSKMAQIPEDSVVRLIFMAGPETARIEVIKVEGLEPPADLREIQRPGKSLGHVGWSFKTSNLSSALAKVREHGGKVLGEMVSTNDPIHGSSKVAAAETPEGAFIELWEEE